MESVTIDGKEIDLEDYLFDFWEPTIARKKLTSKRLYCPTCQASITMFSVTPSGNFRCDECKNLFQRVEWANGDPVAIRPYPFKCPEKCQGRTLADGVRIHVFDGYYEANCTDCEETCYQGKTYRKQALEQLRQKAGEVSDVEEFEDWVMSMEFAEGVPISEVHG